MTQNLVAAYDYLGVTRKVLTQQVTGPRKRQTFDSSVDGSTPYYELVTDYAIASDNS
jgi:hypothetical protein